MRSHFRQQAESGGASGVKLPVSHLGEDRCEPLDISPWADSPPPSDGMSPDVLHPQFILPDPEYEVMTDPGGVRHLEGMELEFDQLFEVLQRGLHAGFGQTDDPAQPARVLWPRARPRYRIPARWTSRRALS